MYSVSETLRFVLAATCLALTACGDDEHNSAQQTCNPLAAETQPITLGTIIAVGQASDGTLYVASGKTTAESVDLLFVSEAGALQRKRVTGGGTSGQGDYSATFEDGASPSRLVIKVRANTVVGMALVHDGGKSFFDELPAQVTVLTVVPNTQVQNLAVHNLPGAVSLEAVATASDASQLVLTFPAVDGMETDFRLFYGSGAQLSERKIIDFSRSSSTWITFQVGDDEYTAVLASPRHHPSLRRANHRR